MKKLLGGVALSAFLALPAMAADLPARIPVKAPVAVVGMYNWTGFYIGGHAGYLFGESDWGVVGGTSASHDIDGFTGGVHAGIQWQFNQWVLGFEGAVSGFGQNGSIACPAVAANTCHSEIDHYWRAGVRAGFAAGATGNWLFYGMGGFARAKLNTHVVVAGVETDADSQHHHGWYGGAGIEYGVTQNFIIGVEAYHVSLGTERHFNDTRDSDLDFTVVQARATWKFGWGGPVVARY